MLQYIQEKYDDVTMEKMSKQFNFSTSYLSKYIVQQTGMSFSELRQEIRLKKACDLLMNSDLQIIDISLMIGYQSAEHFIRLFKQKYDQTPEQYRKSQRIE